MITPRRTKGLCRLTHACCFGVAKPTQMKSGASRSISARTSVSEAAVQRAVRITSPVKGADENFYATKYRPQFRAAFFRAAEQIMRRILWPRFQEFGA